ncbi:MAG TPA: DUF4249 domain-containing protein [Chryseolinea sp.]|nr:DUF4249 domain-containing protein [Chryseolinea sp.]
MKCLVGLMIVSVFGVMISCLPEPLSIDGLPVVKPEIVVSTQMVPDRSLVVLLTKTFGALEGSNDSDPEELLQQIAVDDAVVVITGPDRSDTLVNIGYGFYGDVIIPFVAGEEYSLYVNSASLGEITATTYVKEQIQFEDIEAGLYFNGFGDTLAEVTHTFLDPPGKNWYMLNVQEVEQEDIVENLLNPNSFMKLHDDVDFEGNELEETFRVFPRDYHAGDTIAVSLSNISSDYYEFLQLRVDNRFSLVQYLSEPVNYPSNINGGRGFFNLYIPDVEFFVLK